MIRAVRSGESQGALKQTPSTSIHYMGAPSNLAGARPIHKLSELNAETRMAVCSICGPVRVKGRGIYKKKRRFRCPTPRKENRKAGTLRRRKPYRGLKGRVCERCGFRCVSIRQMDIHHRDHNHENNEPGNLETLCANCHRLEHAEGK